MANHKNQADQEPVVIADAPPSEVELLRLQVKALSDQMAKIIGDQQKIITPPVSTERTAFINARAELDPNAPPWSIKVRATRMGFYPMPNPDLSRGVQHWRRLPPNDAGFTGDEFFLEKSSDYAPEPLGWMQLVTEAPVIPGKVAQTSVPNQVQDPLGVFSGHPQRRIES